MVDGIGRPEDVNKDPGRFLDDMLAVKIGERTLGDIIPNPDEAMPILKAAIKRYLNTPLRPDLRDTPYSAALAVAWSIQGEEGDWFESWLEETGTSTFVTLLRRATDQMRNSLERSLVSKLYETHDKKWEVVRLRYRAGIERAGEILVNCLHKTSGGTARRIYEASDPDGMERAEVEIYVVRPGSAGQGGATHDPQLIFLYFPEDKLLAEIEKHSGWTSDGEEQKNYLTSDDEMLQVLLETIRAGRTGEAPGFDVEAIDPSVTQHIGKPPFGGMRPDGSLQFYFDADRVDHSASEILIGDVIKVKPSTMSPGDLASFAAEVPVGIDMSLASDEQRAAIRRIAGSITDSQTSVSYPNLEYVRCSATFLSESADLPKLSHVGFKVAALYDLDAPMLAHAFELRVSKQGRVNISPDFPQSRIVRRQID